MSIPFLAKVGLPADPYALYDYKVHVGYSNTAGRTVVSPTLTPGEKTLIVFGIGQSLIGNYGVSLYTPTNATKVQNLHINNGTLYRLVDPMLSAAGVDGSYLGRLGDKLINAGMYARVIFIPIAIGGLSVWEWGPQSLYNHRLIAAALRAKALGWLEPNPDVTVVAMWHQGEQDGLLGTTQAQYQAWFIAVQDTLRARGIDIPWLIAKSTTVTNVSNAVIRAACDALVDNDENRFAGPDVDTLTGPTKRQAEGTHLSDLGNDECATLWVTRFDAL